MIAPAGPDWPQRPLGSRAAFTLVELVVATTLGTALVASALGFFINQRLLLKSSEIVSEVQQNVRTAVDMLSRDIRMAGYGLRVNSADLSSWVDWAADLSGTPITFDQNPRIVDGGGTSADAIWIAAVFDEATAGLAGPAASGACVLALGSGQGAGFNTTTRKVIQVGRVETARILAIAGDQLTISTDPTGTRGLRHDYPAGSEVALVTVRGYETHPATLNTYPYRPFLTRDDCTGETFTYDWQRLIAAGISDLQLTRIDDRVDFAVTGEAPVPDRFHRDSAVGDRIRRIRLQSSALIRNNT